jgi:hypothetical protein
MVAKRVQLEDAWQLAARLSALDRIRLLERIASTLEQDIAAQAQPAADRQVEADIPSTWTDEELDKLMNPKRITPAEAVAWLDANPPQEPWGDLGDDEDAGEYIHRMRRKTWSTPQDMLPGDNE